MWKEWGGNGRKLNLLRVKTTTELLALAAHPSSRSKSSSINPSGVIRPDSNNCSSDENSIK